MMEQQRAMVHQLISKLTEVAFDKCVTSTEAPLGSREQRCIQVTVGKYLKSSEFVLAKMAKSAQN